MKSAQSLGPAGAILPAALLLAALWLSACGQVTTRPTPEPPTPTATATPSATPTVAATVTPAPYTPEPTATATLTPTPVLHSIQSGETLIAIAGRYGVSVQAIQEANGVVDPRALRVGQVLIIPTDQDSLLGAGTPTPEPTPHPVQVGPIYFGSSRTGSLWALGQVYNPSAELLEGVRIRLHLLDEDNQPLAVAEALVQTDLLAPGGASPFGVLFEQPPEAFANYFAEIVGAFVAHGAIYYRDLAVHDVHTEGERYHTYRVSGRVANVGPEDAVEVTVTATLYDALDQVVGFRRVEPEHNVVPRGGETTFMIEIVPVGGPAARTVVIAEGRRLLAPTPVSDQ